MVRLIKTLASILATETVLTRRNHGTAINGNNASICKLCEKAEETNLHMLCECTSWIRSMRKIVKEHLEIYMSNTRYAVMMDLWNVDELGKVNQWVTDTSLNLEVAVNDPTLLQLTKGTD